MRKTVVALMALAASAAVAQADPLKLKVGAAANDGTISFTLAVKAGESEESAQVSAAISAGTSAQDKAATVRDAVAQAGVAGAWRAVSASATAVGMTFEHLVGEDWVAVEQVTNLVDTTGSGTSLQTMAQVVDFTLDIDPYASASGFDLEGGPSFLTIAVTNTLTFTRAIQPGESAESLVGQFEAFLVAQETEGIKVKRLGTTSVRLRLDASLAAALNWQVTDTGLLGVATAGAVIGVEDGGSEDDEGRVIDR